MKRCKKSKQNSTNGDLKTEKRRVVVTLTVKFGGVVDRTTNRKYSNPDGTLKRITVV